MQHDSLNFKGKFVEIEWDSSLGGAFPSAGKLNDSTILSKKSGWMSCKLSNSRVTVPCCGSDTITEPDESAGKLSNNFDWLIWRGASGAVIDDFRFDLRFIRCCNQANIVLSFAALLRRLVYRRILLLTLRCRLFKIAIHPTRIRFHFLTSLNRTGNLFVG